MATEERYEFEQATILSPFAVGLPGKRTFFLAMGNQDKWLRIWLEKEHLEALAAGVERLFFVLSQEKIGLPEEKELPVSVEKPQGLPAAELDIIQLTLGYDNEAANIEISAQRSGSQEETPAEVRCRATFAQLKKLANQARSIVAAGRPRCRLCGGPIDPEGHVCPGHN